MEEKFQMIQIKHIFTDEGVVSCRSCRIQVIDSVIYIFHTSSILYSES